MFVSLNRYPFTYAFFYLSRRGSVSHETQSNAYATINKLPMAPSSRRWDFYIFYRQVCYNICKNSARSVCLLYKSWDISGWLSWHVIIPFSTLLIMVFNIGGWKCLKKYSTSAKMYWDSWFFVWHDLELYDRCRWSLWAHLSQLFQCKGRYRIPYVTVSFEGIGFFRVN